VSLKKIYEILVRCCPVLGALIGTVLGALGTYWINTNVQRNEQKDQNKKLIISQYPSNLKDLRISFNDFHKKTTELSLKIDSTYGKIPPNVEQDFFQIKNNLIAQLEILDFFLISFSFDLHDKSEDSIKQIIHIEEALNNIKNVNFKDTNQLLSVQINPYLRKIAKNNNDIIEKSKQSIREYLSKE
jgi:hypothetical protein